MRAGRDSPGSRRAEQGLSTNHIVRPFQWSSSGTHVTFRAILILDSGARSPNPDRQSATPRFVTQTVGSGRFPNRLACVESVPDELLDVLLVDETATG